MAGEDKRELIARVVRDLKDKVVPHKFLCAIDFGSAATGYSFCSKDPSSDDVTVHDWGNGLCKTETAVVFDKRRELKWFGSEATRKYAGLDSDRGDHLYFGRFKMNLFDGSKDLDLKIKSANGKTMLAIDVISKLLIYLRDHFLDKIKRSLGFDLRTNEVLWILTVPAIWDNAAKQLMRHAGKMAGLCSDQEPQRLRIVYEPEAAGLYCTKIDLERFVHDSNKVKRPLNVGDRLLVVDVGGGTADISVLEKLEGERFKTAVSPTGGPWGGNVVSNAIWELIEDTVGQQAAQHWREEDPEGCVELKKTVEELKHAWDGDQESSLAFNLPFGLPETMEDLVRD